MITVSHQTGAGGGAFSNLERYSAIVLTIYFVSHLMSLLCDRPKVDVCEGGGLTGPLNLL